MSSQIIAPKAVDLLRDARARIATPERWTKGCIARDVYGKDIGPAGIDNPESCLCVDGALLHATPYAGAARASLYLSLAARARGFETASKLNDDPATTHADVLALLDDAIALAESMLMEPS